MSATYALAFVAFDPEKFGFVELVELEDMHEAVARRAKKRNRACVMPMKWLGVRITAAPQTVGFII